MRWGVSTGVAMTRARRVTLLRIGLQVIVKSSIHPDGDRGNARRQQCARMLLRLTVLSTEDEKVEGIEEKNAMNK